MWNRCMTHYHTLQVPDGASAEQIKRQYRKMSLELHPDRPTGNAAKFKEINEAYEVLSDPNLRAQYDEELNPRMPPPDMLFDMLFKNPQMFRVVQQKPSPIVIPLEITLDQAYTGCAVPVEIERVVHENQTKRTERETCYVDVFPGIDAGETILLPLKGHIGADYQQGDAKVVIHVLNPTKLTRNGLDLCYVHHLSLKDALCGFTFDLEYLQSKQLKIANLAGNIITPNFRKIIPNMGMRRDNKQGALIISFSILFPTSLSIEALSAFKELLP
jgi:DnaJ-class molecular chaperone